MKDNKNIDRLFQEKFKDFEIAPNDAVWDRISESLPKKKKKRRVIALWWQIGGVAAVLALMLTVGINVFNSDGNNSQELPVVNTDDKNDRLKDENDKTSTIKNQNDLNRIEDDNSTIVDSNIDSEEKSNLKESENNGSQKKYPTNQLTTPNNSVQKRNAVANNSKVEEKTEEITNNSQKRTNLNTVNNRKEKNTKVANQSNSNSISNLEKTNKAQLKNDAELKSAIKKSIDNNETAVTENNTSIKQGSKSTQSESNKTGEKETENSLIENPEKESIEKAIAENKETIEEEKEENLSRWSIAPSVAPVYFNSLGKGSSLDNQFNENAKSSDINMSYGIAGSYAISKKLKIRAGVNRVNLSQTTSEVYAFTGAETAARGIGAEFKNIAFREDAQHVSLMSAKMMNRASAPELFNTKIAGNIDQKFGFIEVPVELEYRLLDKKFGINMIGGFSTFVLSENEIYADINGSSTLIGEANNINNTSFSANFGLGMDYNLSKQWNINLEPTFKYQINTFNNTSGNFNPFIIGVYTGLSFKF